MPVPHKTKSKTPTRGIALLDLIIMDIRKFYEVLPLLDIRPLANCMGIKNRNQFGNKKGKRTITVRQLRDSSIIIVLFEPFIREYN